MNNILTFDEPKLVVELARLSSALRVLFAAACAERQMSAYCDFCSLTGFGDSEALRRMLADTWMNPGAHAGNDVEHRRQLKVCMSLVPQEDLVQHWTELATYAQNAGMSVAYALRARINGKAQEAAWAARTAYESIDHFIINRENIDISEPGAEARVLGHSVMQAELARQQRDINDLLAVKDRGAPEVAVLIRGRSTNEAAIFFGSTPAT